MSQEIIDAAMSAVRDVLAQATRESTRDDGSVDLDAVTARLNGAADAARRAAEQLAGEQHA